MSLVDHHVIRFTKTVIGTRSHSVLPVGKWLITYLNFNIFFYAFTAGRVLVLLSISQRVTRQYVVDNLNVLIISLSM